MSMRYHCFDVSTSWTVYLKARKDQQPSLAYMTGSFVMNNPPPPSPNRRILFCLGDILLLKFCLGAVTFFNQWCHRAIRNLEHSNFYLFFFSYFKVKCYDRMLLKGLALKPMSSCLNIIIFKVMFRASIY